MYFDFNNQNKHYLTKPISSGSFEWIEDTSILTENFIKNYNKYIHNKDSQIGFTLNADVWCSQ